ncbi:MAG TPA: PilW family protein [Kofleriaceae bacterium]|nr:PilW family protein [Kofleriaceae bacterium]
MSAARPTADQRGMTLVELMVAVVILGIVVAAAFSVAFSIMNSYREHRRAVNVERSARGAMAVLTEAVRNASPGVPNGQIIDLVGCEDTWHGIQVENSSTGPDALDIVYATGDVMTSLTTTFDQASTELRVLDGSLFVPGNQVLVTDFTKGHLLTVLTVAQAGPEWIIGLSGTPASLCAGVVGFTYDARATVLRAQKARFSISDVGGVPALYMDPDGPSPGGPLEPEAVAEGVEDLQIAIGVDRDGDGRIGDDVAAGGDDDDWVYNHASDINLPLLALTPYRAIRLTVIARSLDDTTQVATSLRAAAEDHAAAVAPDAFRRRNLSTTVEIRNLEGSP